MNDVNRKLTDLSKRDILSQNTVREFFDFSILSSTGVSACPFTSGLPFLTGGRSAAGLFGRWN
jgi:hypothetical protein